LADRIKIARKAEGDDINLAIQFILNCGTEMAGSCFGGYHTSTYEFIKKTGFVPYDTCMPYVACSEGSTEGFCPQVNTSCSAANTCRTCDTFAGMGGACSEIDLFPNATVAEYGLIENNVEHIMTELYARGPVAACVNAEPLVAYQGGVFVDDSAEKGTNHIVSIVGWGVNAETDNKYWIVRNSWGSYWGEMGYFRIEMVRASKFCGLTLRIIFLFFSSHTYPCWSFRFYRERTFWELNPKLLGPHLVTLPSTITHATKTARTVEVAAVLKNSRTPLLISKRS
jgi:cathepsin X